MKPFVGAADAMHLRFRVKAAALGGGGGTASMRQHPDLSELCLHPYAVARSPQPRQDLEVAGDASPTSVRVDDRRR